MDRLTATKRELVVANRIIANEAVVDAFGHISVRHPTNPACFLLSISRSAEHVEAENIKEYALNGEPLASDGRPDFLERFIHGGIYACRPDVSAVLHCHSPVVLPFTIGDAALRPVISTAAVMGDTVPVWDIADRFGDATNLLVTRADHAADLAGALGQGNVVLMRGHGYSACAATLPQVVQIGIYLKLNAAVQQAAAQFGSIKYLSPGEVRAGRELATASRGLDRAWTYWARRAHCEELLDPGR